MAIRNSPGRRVPGNPLAGVLRQTARAARSTTRRSVAIPGPPGEEGPRGPAGPPVAGPRIVVAGDYTTDVAGYVTVSFGEDVEFPTVVATPVVGATGAPPVVAAVAAISNTSVTLVAYGLDGLRTAARLHVAVFASELPEDPPVDWVEQPKTEGP